MSTPNTTSHPDANWKRVLEAVPQKNTAAIVKYKNQNPHGDPQTADVVTIIVKNIRPAYLVPPVSWFVPYKPQREITLDKLGTYLWNLCDGKKNVEQIVDEFKAHYDLTFHEAKTCVTDYLKKLIQRGILAVVIDH